MRGFIEFDLRPNGSGQDDEHPASRETTASERRAEPLLKSLPEQGRCGLAVG
jgi:hypothetical protein